MRYNEQIQHRQNHLSAAINNENNSHYSQVIYQLGNPILDPWSCLLYDLIRLAQHAMERRLVEFMEEARLYLKQFMSKLGTECFHVPVDEGGDSTYYRLRLRCRTKEIIESKESHSSAHVTQSYSAGFGLSSSFSIGIQSCYRSVGFGHSFSFSTGIRSVSCLTGFGQQCLIPPSYPTHPRGLRLPRGIRSSLSYSRQNQRSRHFLPNLFF